MLKSKFFLGLAICMAGIVVLSNFLVQFPINYFGMENILTYAAFSYPVTFLITDLANRKYGKFIAKKIVYLGFLTGVSLTFYFSTNFEDLISIRIAVGSGTAFLFSQLLDVHVFDILRRRTWFVAPLASSLIGSLVDTLIFFSISFYNTEMPWISLAAGDFVIKLVMAILMLIPFRLLLDKISNETKLSAKMY